MKQIFLAVLLVLSTHSTWADGKESHGGDAYALEFHHLGIAALKLIEQSDIASLYSEINFADLGKLINDSEKKVHTIRGLKKDGIEVNSIPDFNSKKIAVNRTYWEELGRNFPEKTKFVVENFLKIWNKDVDAQGIANRLSEILVPGNFESEKFKQTLRHELTESTQRSSDALWPDFESEISRWKNLQNGEVYRICMDKTVEAPLRSGACAVVMNVAHIDCMPVMISQIGYPQSSQHGEELRKRLTDKTFSIRNDISQLIITFNEQLGARCRSLDPTDEVKCMIRKGMDFMTDQAPKYIAEKDDLLMRELNLTLGEIDHLQVQ